MSSIDVNKYAGAVLAALLLAVGLGVFVDMLYEPGHGDHAMPAFLVGVEAAVDHGAGAGEEAVDAAPVEVAAVIPIGVRLAEADVAAGKKAACPNRKRPVAVRGLGPAGTIGRTLRLNLRSIYLFDGNVD